MHRASIFISVLAIVLVGLGSAGSLPGVIARDEQAATPAALMGHPVVGTWKLNFEADNAPVNAGANGSYATFHGDGTYIEIHASGRVGIGAWQPTGAQTADLTIVFQDVDDAENRFSPGTVTVRQAVTVAEAGDAFTAPFTYEVRAPDGTLVLTGTAMATGTRLAIEPMVPLGTPLAGTPTS
jgi:hypothetical protein